MPEDMPADRAQQAAARTRTRPAGAPSTDTPATGSTAVTSGDAASARRKGESDAWGAMSLVVSGVLFWGGVGGLLTAWWGNRLPVMIGLLVGMFAGLYLVWLRYGRA